MQIVCFKVGFELAELCPIKIKKTFKKLALKKKIKSNR